jgi:hypothetical protein
MLLVVVAVAVHGNRVPTKVAVHLPAAPVLKVQNPNDPVVISRLCALATREVNDDRVQLEVLLPVGLVNPMLGEWSVCSAPTVPQLAAEVTDGSTNAHSAIAPAKSKTPFLDNFFITNSL